MLNRGVSIHLHLYVYFYFMKIKFLKPSCVLCLSQKCVWNRHIFVGDSIRVPSCEHSVGSEIFAFLSIFYTPLPVPLSRPITSLELWPIRPFPSPDFIEDGSIRISSANLNSTWLIVFYPPNPSLVGIILAFNIRRFQAAQNWIILGFQN